jgi:hypothetical protein
MPKWSSSPKSKLGRADGLAVGLADGLDVGLADGLDVGAGDGAGVGAGVGGTPVSTSSVGSSSDSSRPPAAGDEHRFFA